MAKGHTPRNYAQRYAKWSAKFSAFSNPTVASTILSNVSAVAQQNFQTNVSKFASVNEQVAGILSEYGIVGPARALYQGFAMKVMRVINRLGQSQAVANAVAGIKAYYVNAFGANPQILDTIVQALTGSATGYVS